MSNDLTFTNAKIAEVIAVVLSWQQYYTVSMTEANQLILFREIIVVWLCESYKTQSAVLLSIEANGSCGGHCIIEG